MYAIDNKIVAIAIGIAVVVKGCGRGGFGDVGVVGVERYKDDAITH